AKMIVARASVVESSLDRAKLVRSVEPGKELAETGKVRVGAVIARFIRRKNVFARVIGVPQFDQCPANRLSGAVQHASAHVGDDALGRSEVVIEMDEVVVFIKRDIFCQRVKRSLRQVGRERKRFRIESSSREKRSSGCELPQKSAPRCK